MIKINKLINFFSYRNLITLLISYVDINKLQLFIKLYFLLFYLFYLYMIQLI